MHLVARPPRSPLLRQHVDILWFCERPGASGAEVVSPTGRAQIVIPIAERSNAPILGGIYTGPQPIDSSDQRRACGAVFRVGHTGAFITAPLDDFTNAQPEIDRSFWEGELSLADRLADARTSATVFETLERILLGCVNNDWAASSQIDTASRMLDQGLSVGSVVAALGVDRRTFGRHFSQHVGVGPKQFSRTRRFQRTVRALRMAGNVPLAELALQLGYSDQAHMTREFREFSGSTPRSAHGIESISPGHFTLT